MTALLVLKGPSCEVFLPYTAISGKVGGRSACDNPETYCGWFWVHCSSKKFERIAGETMDIIMFANAKGKQQKYRFHSYSVRNSVLIISHIAFRDWRVHNFPTIFLGIAVYALHRISHWCNNSILQGPWRDTIWRGCIHPRLVFPPDYSLSPPKMRLTCEMFHPNGKWKQKHS